MNSRGEIGGSDNEQQLTSNIETEANEPSVMAKQ